MQAARIVEPATGEVPVKIENDHGKSLLTKIKNNGKHHKMVKAPTFSYDRLKHVEIVDKGLCDITTMSFKTFNRFYVLPRTKNTKLIILGLKEDIEFCVRKQAGGLTSLPAVGDVVLAKYIVRREFEKYVRFDRAVIREVFEDAAKVRLFYVDIGEEKVLEISDLRRPDKNVMKHPVFAREVELAGDPEKMNELMWPEYLELLRAFQPVNYMIQLVNNESPVPTVRLLYDYNLKKLESSPSMNKDIEKLHAREWPWQIHYENGNITDAAMQRVYNNRIMTTGNFYGVSTLKINEEEMLMEILMYRGPDDFFCVPRDGNMGSDLDVLQRQIAKYTSTVTQASSPYYPEAFEICFGRLKKKPKSEWTRCYRSGSGFVVKPDMTGDHNEKDMEYRYMPPDFARQPYAIFCKLEEELAPQFEENKEKIASILTVGKLVKLRIKSQVDWAYVVSCRAVTLALAPELVAVPMLKGSA